MNKGELLGAVGRTVTDNPPELCNETQYVKLKSVDDITDLNIKGWVKQSVNMQGWRW